MAMVPNGTIAVDTPRGPKRKAAQTNKGMVAWPQGRETLLPVRTTLVYTVTHRSDIKTSNIVNSDQRTTRQRSTGRSNQLSISGVTNSAPTASPDHHVSHSLRNSLQCSCPERQSDRLPIVAATAVLITAAKTTNFSTSNARLNGLRASVKRRRR